MLNLLNGRLFFFTFSFFIKDFKLSAPNKQMNTTLRQRFTLILDVLYSVEEHNCSDSAVPAGSYVPVRRDKVHSNSWWRSATFHSINVFAANKDEAHI